MSLALAACVLAAPAAAQLADAPTVERRALGNGLYVLFGSGGGQVAGNVLVSVGAQGALLVDTGFPAFVPGYLDTLAELGSSEVVIAINTHWHDDHSEGNKLLGQSRALLIAQTRSRARLTRDNRINVVRTVLEQPAFPPHALPALSFDDRVELYFNDERIDVLHAAPAHTAGDAVAIFRGRNTVHTGDLFLSSAYPFFDVDNGGSFDGAIAFLERLLDEIDRDTIVVPGHGEIATYGDVERYLAMLTTVRERIAALVAEGATLEQVVAAAPTTEWDARYGNPATYFIDRAYASLAQP